MQSQTQIKIEGCNELCMNAVEQECHCQCGGLYHSINSTAKLDLFLEGTKEQENILEVAFIYGSSGPVRA